MKNTLLFLSLIAVLFSCQKELINSTQNTDSEVLEEQSFRNNLILFDDFKQYGELHNLYLTNVKDNFLDPSNLNSIEEAVDYINSFHISFVNTFSISNDKKNEYANLLTLSKDYVITEAFMNKFVSINGAYYQEIQKLFNLGGIDEFEKKSLIEFGQKVSENHNGSLSTPSFKEYLINLKYEWESQNYTVNGHNGYILPIVLSISLHSLEWWSQNPDAYGRGSFRALPGWAAADAAGAAVSALASVTKDIVKDDLDGGGAIQGAGKRAATAAVMGAVTASTGAVKKVKDLIQYFF